MSTQIANAKIQEIDTVMGYFKNKNYCIDKSMLKTCRRGGVSITLPSLKKKYIKNNF